MLLILPLGLMLLLYHDAYATTFTATQSGNWNDANTWGGATPPVTNDFGNTITIPSGITVTNPIQMTVINNGLINNSGTIENGWSFVNSGTITNSGTIENFRTICIGDNCSPFKVNITNNDNGHITNSGIMMLDLGLFKNFGFLDNSNQIANDGTIDNYGMITNEASGSMTTQNFFSGIIRNQCVSTFTNSGSITDNTVVELCSACTTPVSGDWIIDNTCKISSNVVTPSNVIVQNNARLYIPKGLTLDIDFATKHLLIKFGSGIFIRSSGTIK